MRELSDDVLFDEDTAVRVLKLKRRVLETGEPAKIEASVDDGGNRHWYAFSIEPDIDANGEVSGLFTTATDIDDVKYREQVLKTLLRELSHRSKNLLAIIQAIASQTARSSTSLDGFLVAFRGRLQSLSRSQDLVTDSDWRGAGFRELVEGQLGLYTDNSQKQIAISGVDAHLLPNAALHLGLALHELAVNAASRSALSSPDGRISIVAQVRKGENGEGMLHVDWNESFPQSDTTPPLPDINGFGSVVLERIVPQALSAKAKYQIDDGRVSYSLVIPSSQFEDG
nr:PAS domain-containing sensor histidine kinase [Hoeflea marina]